MIRGVLQKELPGLRGFSPESVRKMRSFAEFWSRFINRSSVTTEINRDEFLGISFTHHMTILNKTKDINEVLFYIHEAVTHSWSTRKLRDALNLGLYKEGQESLPNNFTATMPSSRSALQAIRMFKDEYLLDFINVEDIDETYGTVDERIVENQIVANVCRFMMTFGRDFTFVGNQYHLEVYGVEHYPDRFVFRNPGSLLVSVEQYFEGGTSICRNSILQKMFEFIGEGERAGSGVDTIRKGWASNKWPEPVIRELYDPEQVELTLFLGSKTDNEPINEPTNADILSVYELIKAEPTISKAKIAQRLKISLSTVKRRIDELEEAGRIKHSGPNKGGRWEILI